MSGASPPAAWLLRQLVAVVILPLNMAVIIPLWLARRNDTPLALGAGMGRLALQALGLALIALGLVLFGASLHRFTREGQGTLAPWDPPRHLVVQGPYRYVRNPMISGVLLVLFGEAGVLLSRPQLEWALVFLVLNLIYIPLVEEPMLIDRFGAEYREYRRHVRGLLPRWRPWEPEGPAHRD
jgi:protein-S-isoprenylcysteine O-methyltransferase Ste14